MKFARRQNEQSFTGDYHEAMNIQFNLRNSIVSEIVSKEGLGNLYFQQQSNGEKWLFVTENLVIRRATLVQHNSSIDQC